MSSFYGKGLLRVPRAEVEPGLEVMIPESTGAVPGPHQVLSNLIFVDCVLRHDVARIRSTMHFLRKTSRSC